MKTKNFWSRRDFLFRAGGGISGVALAHLLEQQGLLAAEPACSVFGEGAWLQSLCIRPPHFKPRAKAVISLFMTGGPSAVDLWDYKPGLTKCAGQPLDEKVQVGDVIVRQGYPGPLMPSPFEFKRYGQSGKLVSEVFPNIADRTSTRLHSSTRSTAGPTTTSRRTMKCSPDKSESDFPARVPGSHMVWVARAPVCRRLSSSTILAAAHRRSDELECRDTCPRPIRERHSARQGDPIMDLKPVAGMTPETQRSRLDLLAKLNELDMEKYPGSSDLAARISSYELAYRMQGCAPQAIDINTESEATKKLYGMDDAISEPFGRQCLLARRLVEHGVRFVQLFQGGMGNQNTDTWDAHSNIKTNHHSTQRNQTCRLPASDGSQGSRASGFHACDLARRIWPDADLSARCRTGSQSRCA